MGKGSFIAIVALLIAVAGAIVAFAAYFKHRSCTFCDDLDDIMEDDDLDYYATQLDDEEDSEEPVSAAPSAGAPSAAAEDKTDSEDETAE